MTAEEKLLMDLFGPSQKEITETVERLFWAKFREVLRPDGFEDWKKTGHWTPARAEGLGE